MLILSLIYFWLKETHLKPEDGFTYGDGFLTPCQRLLYGTLMIYLLLSACTLGAAMLQVNSSSQKASF